MRTITVGTLVEVDTGEWCDHCLLPSKISTTVILYDHDNPMVRLARRVTTYCTECGVRT